MKISKLINLQKDARSKKAYKNIIGLFGLKGLNIAIGLIQVPIVLDYLDPTRYGIWITLSSVLGWFALFDVGFGHGLRNRLAESIATNEIKNARIYVSTTYGILIIIFAALFVLFFVVSFFIDWTKVLNTPGSMASELSILVVTVFFFFCARFVTKIIQSIANAKQEPALAQAYSVVGRLIALLIILLLVHYAESRLLYLGIVLASSPVLVGIVLSVILFKTRYRDIQPSIHLIRKSAVKHVMNLGIKFFIIQVAAIVFYQTNNIIIAQMFGPAEVTPYNIAFRYFGLITMGFTIIISPYWSAITDAFAKNEFAWIKNTISTLRKIWLVFLGITGLMYLGTDFIIELWLGDQVKIPLALSVAIAIYVPLQSYNNIFSSFVNGTGKLKIQMYRVTIMTLLYIPLTVYFTKIYGIQGIMFTMIIFDVITAVFYEVQYRKIITGNAKGIWNR